jgi:hypothetical protein
MRRSTLFLIGAFVCLFAVNLTMAQTPGSDNIQPLSHPNASGLAVTTLSAAEVAEKLAQARSLLKSQSVLSEDNSPLVALATLDSRTSELDVVTLAKESFLTPDGVFTLTTPQGKSLRLRIVRPNYVNTSVSVTDVATGRSLVPLLVKYPIERDGAFIENAFYTSAHPALVSSAIVDEGHRYLANMFAQATDELRSNGVTIPADLVAVAKHLVIVEHTDHKRFHDDGREEIYPEVLALYALNQGNTFRYSVSSAGAGGMIQMIPKTYDAIRQQHPNVTLEPDFVTGMQNHANALKAMLLYVNDTWNHLKQNDEVQEALRSGIATKTELLAAGYNSNPYRLPQYLSDGGSYWRTLIPAETQMYLAIYNSVDSNVDFGNRKSAQGVDVSVSATSQFGASIARQTTSALLDWISKQIIGSGAALSHVMP